MENILYIKIGDLNISFLLVTCTSEMQKERTYVEKLYDYKGRGFGNKLVEVEVAKYLIHRQNYNRELQEFFTLFYEKLLVGDGIKTENQELFNQLQKLFKEARNLIERSEESFLENSGLKGRFYSLLKRTRFDTVKFPIDKIIFLNQYVPSNLIVQTVKKVFGEIPVDFEKGDFPKKNDAHYSVIKKLYLNYQNENIHILDRTAESSNELTSMVSFNVKFALDTHIHLVIFEAWREQGIQKKKDITQFSFVLPFFYTDDTIQLAATFKKNEGYNFTIVHADSGEKAYF